MDNILLLVIPLIHHKYQLEIVAIILHILFHLDALLFKKDHQITFTPYLKKEK